MDIASHTDDELRRAWRACRLLNVTFEQAMVNPALAIAIRRMADCERRRAARAQAAQLDHKRAAANDID